MRKFSDYAQTNEDNLKNSNSNSFSSNEGAFKLLKEVASKYEGASEKELIFAILAEAKKARENGTLSDSDITNFINLISPMLNDKQRKQLEAVVAQIKKG